MVTTSELSAQLTVIVCSHERPDDLSRCLDALATHAAGLEILVVDSGSQPPLAQVVDAYRSVLPRLRYIYEAEPGLSRARNRGLAAASGQIVAFVDDDARVTADWAEHLYTAYDDLSVGCAGGSCRAAFSTPQPAWLSEQLLQFAGVTAFGSEAREPRGAFEFPFGANLSFRREALMAAGGFDVRLGRTGGNLLSGEEFDAMKRVSAQGWRLWLQPNAVVDHSVAPARCSRRYYWRRIYWEGITRARSRPGWRRPGGLLLEIPAHLFNYLRSGDSFYLYRASAETLGHLTEWRQQLVRRFLVHLRPGSHSR